MYDERNHQDAIKRCVYQIGWEFTKECLPDERARQEAIRYSAFYELWKPKPKKISRIP